MSGRPEEEHTGQHEHRRVCPIANRRTAAEHRRATCRTANDNVDEGAWFEPNGVNADIDECTNEKPEGEPEVEGEGGEDGNGNKCGGCVQGKFGGECACH